MPNVLKKMLILLLAFNILTIRGYTLDKELYLSGEVVSIKQVLKYSFVTQCNKDSKLRQLDIITNIVDLKDNMDIDIEELSSKLKDEKKVVATIIRNNKSKKVKLEAKDIVGLELENEINYIGTVTAIDKNNRFVGLAHPNNLGRTIITDELVEYSKVYRIDKMEVEKKPYLYGIKANMYGLNYLGFVDGHSDVGIKGEILSPIVNLNRTQVTKANKGEAIIYCKSPITNKFESYTINITRIGKSYSLFEVTDKRLLEYKGGIILGMSGSPIVQDGKLVGAVRASMYPDYNTGKMTNIDKMIKSQN